MDAPLLSQPKRVVLMGFMGSGKTTVGELLTASLGWRFIDLDKAVEEHCGRTVSQIFANSGEEHFRREEAAALLRCSALTQVVLALGGGAMESHANQILLRKATDTALVYLHAPFADLQQRCGKQAHEADTVPRPLFADVVAAEARFYYRRPIYEAHATLQCDTSKQSAEQVAASIFQQLFQSGHQPAGRMHHK